MMRAPRAAELGAAPPRARAPRAPSPDPPWVRVLLIGIALVVPRPLPGRAAGRRLRAGALARASASTWRRITRARRRWPRSGSRCWSRRSSVPLNLVFGVAAAWAIAQVRFPRQAAADHADRPAFRGLAGRGGPDLRAALRRAGLARPVAAGARHQDHLRRAGHRPGHDLRHLPVRGARADPADAGAGDARKRRRRSSLGASGWQTFWRVTLPNISGGCSTASILLQRARHGRVRRRVRRLRATSAGRPTPCRCTSRSSTTSTSSPAPSRWPRCWRCWRWCTLVAEEHVVEWRMHREARQSPRGVGRGVRTHEHRGPRHHQALRQLRRAATTSASTSPDGELVALLGPVGLGQDDAAAHHRRPRVRRRRQRALRRRGRHRAQRCATAASASSSSTTRCSAT